MLTDSAQRFSILLMLFGGFMEISGLLSYGFGGIHKYGQPMMAIAIILGTTAFVIDIYSEIISPKIHKNTSEEID
jgi:hypothetical protein